MTLLTCQLLGIQRRRARKWAPLLTEVAARLKALYGTPDLGNYSDPYKELVYILLSAKTLEKQYQVAARKILTAFPNPLLVSKASHSVLAKAIAAGGLGQRKARQLKRLGEELVKFGGHQVSRKLRRLNSQELFEFLVSLPGVGEKSALCVMMCAFRLDVFPVDANIRRILHRLGVTPHLLRHETAQRTLPALVPDGIANVLHRCLIVHARGVCSVRRPSCHRCCLIDLCKCGSGVLRKSEFPRCSRGKQMPSYKRTSTGDKKLKQDKRYASNA